MRTAMKKIYQNPETKTVKVQLSEMIASSTVVGINASADALDDETTVASRRGGSIWDDDED